MLQFVIRLVLVLAAAALSIGCGPGASPLLSRPVAQPAVPRPQVDVTFVITVPTPAPGLKVAYVSAATRSASIAVNGQTPSVANLNTGQPTYNLIVRAPVGSNTFLVRLFDGIDAGGNLLSTAQVAATVVAGQDNVVPLTTQGVPASIQLSIDNPRPTQGVAATLALSVAARDASGSTIVGTYSQPLTLTNSDTSGGVTLASTNVTAPATINVTYNGSATGPVTIGASASGVQPSNVTSAVITPAAPGTANGGVVTTFAGHNPGYFDGTGLYARFNNPISVLLDPSGNVYVSDFANFAVRKVTPGGVVTTLAGGTKGTLDGTGAAAQFGNPAGLNLDAINGVLYVADYGNNLIRRITGTGVVTTVAGQPTAGFADGTGTAAQFNTPFDLAIDANGNIYVTDSTNHRIRKIDSAGVVTTLAGQTTAGTADGTGTAAQFNTPTGITVDGAGDLYVDDSNNHRIRKVTAAGVVTTLTGSTPGFADGTGTAAQFNTQVGLSIGGPTNQIFVADVLNNRIRAVTTAGVTTTFAGSGTAGSADGTGTAASFSTPYDVSVNASGNLAVGDTTSNIIRAITSGGLVSSLAGGSSPILDGTGVAAQFKSPFGIAVDQNGLFYVTDSGNQVLRTISSAGVVTTIAGQLLSGYVDGTGLATKFNTPSGIAVDKNGNVYIADSANHVIRIVTSGNVVTTLAGSPPGGFADGTGSSAKFNGLFDVAVDDNGNVFVADTTNNLVRKVTPGGVVTTIAGNGGAGTADGTGTNAQFNHPIGITLDVDGTLYVADFTSNLIRRVTSTGVVTTLAGQTTAGTADGTGTAAQFSGPFGIEVNSSGDVYVTDSATNLIRKVTPAGVVTTLAGQTGPGATNGTGTGARFNNPVGLTVDANGVIYVADYGNHLIRKIQ